MPSCRSSTVETLPPEQNLEFEGRAGFIETRHSLINNQQRKPPLLERGESHK
jgi:hypothetical protein